MRFARVLLAFLSAILLLPASATFGAPPDPPDPRFGIVEAFWSPGQASEVGAGWDRVLFSWKALQPNSPNDWNAFYFPDDVLAREIAQRREVVGILMTAPAWASGSDDPRQPPRNLYLPFDHADNHWGAFVMKMAARYKGRIDSWIIWNEPDIWNGGYGSTWLGSEADYYQLLKVAYQAAKSVNPSAKIVMGGLTYWWDKAYGRELYLKRLLEIAAKDPSAKANGFYFDVANVHLYNLPQQLYTIPQLFKQILAEYGLNKPVWVGEVNVVPYDDPVSPLPRVGYRASIEEQASFVIQAVSLALAGGVERIALYKMRDDPVQPPDSEAYGLTRKDGSARPSYAAFRAVAIHLAGAKEARWNRSKDLNTVVVQRNGEITTVLWNSGAKPLTAIIPASAASGLIVDKYGFSAGIAPINGQYLISLPPATAASPAGDPQPFFIGGDPFMLVEKASRAIGPVTSATPEPAIPEPTPRAELLKLPPATEGLSSAAGLAQDLKVREAAKQTERIATLVVEAKAAIARQDWRSATVKIQEIEQIDPQDPRGRQLQTTLKEARAAQLRSLAAESYRTENWRGAYEALSELLILYPGDPTYKLQIEGVAAEIEKSQLLWHAQEALSYGNLSEAQQSYELVLRKDPRNRKALEGLETVRMYLRYQSMLQAVP